MRVLIFGATGMIGQAVLRECLLDAGVEAVASVGRSVTGRREAKLRDIVRGDLLNYDGMEAELTGWDACFFCLGVTSQGMTEAAYERVTYGITVAAAEVLARLNPRMTFVFVSGAGADSSERGRIMWARVKGRAENAVLRVPFAGSYVFRPGMIVPLHGIQSRTRLYRVLYTMTKPIWPLMRRMFPNHVLTTEQIGLAMLSVAREGFPKRVMEAPDIRTAADRYVGRPVTK